MPKIESANDKLDLAIQIERVAATIYTLIAQQFDKDPSTRELFQRLAEEETQHANRIELLKSQYLHDPRAFGEIALDAARMRELLEEAQSLAAMLRDGTSLTAAEARRLMIELENEFADAHAQNLATNSDPRAQALFELLAAQDRLHATLLTDGPATEDR